MSSIACSDNGFGFETISSKTDWLATVRGRLGVTWGNWLFYGTGGAAWGRVDTTLTLSCLVGGCGGSATTLFALNGCWQEIGRSGPSGCHIDLRRRASVD